MTDLTDRAPAEVRAHIAAEGLRDVAHFIERNPGFAAQPGRPLAFRYFCTGAARFRELAETLDGELTIDGDGSTTYAHVTREFGPVLVDVYGFADNVCEQVVTGVETVEKETVEWRIKPAPAPAVIDQDDDDEDGEAI